MCQLKLEKVNSGVVLFIHGFFGNIETFRPQGEFIKKYGLSYALVTYPSDYFNLIDFVDCILEKLLDAGVEKFSVLGTSMGGFTAQLIAARYNSRIDSLILSNTFASTEVFRRQNRLISSIAPYLPEALIKFHLKRVAKKEYGKYEEVGKILEWVEQLRKKDILARMNALFSVQAVEFEKNFPVAVLDSADDVTIPEDLKSELRFKARPDFEYTFPYGGHFPYVFNRKEFNRVILDFLRGVYSI